MNTMRVEIHFHQQDEASGLMLCDTVGNGVQKEELLFFSWFTATQLDDLRCNDMEAATWLANTLLSLALPIAPLTEDLKPFVAFILGSAPSSPRLVDHKGTPGVKMFGGELRWARGARTDFRLLRKGFGILGRGRVYYVRHSVIHLLKYFGRRRQHDADYLDYLWCLANIAAGCGQSFLNGTMLGNNYLDEGVKIMAQWLGTYQTLGPSWAKQSAAAGGTTDRTEYLALLGDSTAQRQVPEKQGDNKERSQNLGRQEEKGTGMMRIEIYFYQPKEASIFVKTNAIGDDQLRYELILFSFYAAMQLLNLGEDIKATSSLAGYLDTFELPLAPFDDDLKPFTAFITSTDPNMPTLVDYTGSRGMKMFGGELTLEPKMSFELIDDGVDLSRPNTLYYGSMSVLVLLKYLAKKRMSNPEFLWSLANVASNCGKTYLNGNLTADNYGSQAISIARRWINASNANLGPRWITTQGAQPDRVGFLAQSGLPEAQYKVGLMHYNGQGRVQDYKAAFDHFERAAKQGFCAAKHMLGCMYAMGQGVEESSVEAIKWITEASLEGLVGAQETLGQMYSTGVGVSRNLKEAVKWYDMAAKQGSEEAKKKLLEIGS